jgi:thioredoxin reductase (NADPH)
MRTADEIYDILIIGGGPAGLTAGIYAARARAKVLLVESYSIMGQATMTADIENYPGIDKTGGFELIEKMKKQATDFGLKCVDGTVSKISSPEKHVFKAETECGKSFISKAVIVASGAMAKKLNVPGEAELTGRGVSYCATCDGAFFRDKDVIVVGGGDTAVEEGIFLTKFANKVTIVHRRDSLRATRIIQERAAADPKVFFRYDSVVNEIKGASKVSGVVLKNVKTGELSEHMTDGVFIFTGWQPNTSFVKDLVELGNNAEIIVDAEMRTSRKGVFSCGDCAGRPLHQVVTACGDGAVAANTALKYVDEIKDGKK